MGLSDLTILQAVFESTAEGILLVNKEGKITQFNQRFRDMWKIPDEIAVANTDDRLLKFILEQLHEPDKFLSKIREIQQNPDVISEDQIEFKDGRYFVRFSRPLKMDNVSYGRLWNFRDVTGQKKSEEIFKAITELSPDIISIVSRDGELLFNSNAAERIHGYTKEEMEGKNTLDFIHEDDRQAVIETMNYLFANPGSMRTVQYRYLNKDKSYGWMEATAYNHVDNPLIRGLVTISREIGNRKKLEEDLKNALNVRDEFLSIASHELKTPMTSLKLQLQMMKRSPKYQYLVTPDSPKSESIEHLLEQVESLQCLIEDLLSVSRIRTGQFNLKFAEENLSEVVFNLIEHYRELFKEAKCPLDVNIESNIILECDKARLEQVFINLMSNGIKYAPQSDVAISLIKKNGIAEFRISDKGPGIPSDKHELIFKRFERLADANYSSGLGIGLYISKNIVEGHRGDIRVESVPGKGTTFIVCLPLK